MKNNNDLENKYQKLIFLMKDIFDFNIYSLMRPRNEIFADKEYYADDFRMTIQYQLYEHMTNHWLLDGLIHFVEAWVSDREELNEEEKAQIESISERIYLFDNISPKELQYYQNRIKQSRAYKVYAKRMPQFIEDILNIEYILNDEYLRFQIDGVKDFLKMCKTSTFFLSNEEVNFYMCELQKKIKSFGK